jgi:hypothetical protein
MFRCQRVSSKAQTCAEASATGEPAFLCSVIDTLLHKSAASEVPAGISVRLAASATNYFEVHACLRALAAVLLGVLWLAISRLVYEERGPPARPARLAARRVSLATGDGCSRIVAPAAVLAVLVAPAAGVAVSGPCVLLGAISTSDRTRPLRVAVVLFGESGKLDGRDMKRKGTPAFDLVAHYNNHARYVLNPIRQAGMHVDVLAQDGTVPTSPTLLNLYKPCAISHIKTMNIFESQEAAVRLQRHWQELHGMPHNWVVLMRWDIMFFSAIDLRQLNPRLFYSVVWCEWFPVAASYVPHPLPGFPGRRCQTWGVTRADEELGGFMDFIFIARPALMETVFVNLSIDFLAHRFNQSGRVICLKARGLGVCAHSLLGDRIKHLVHRANVRIGRYLIHGLDYNFRRNVRPAEEDCMHRGLHWLRSRDNVTAGGNDSLVWAEQPWSTAQCQPNRGIGGCLCGARRHINISA